MFGLLGWHPRMAVSLHPHESGTLVVRRDPDGGSVLTDRTMVAVPAPILRWCGFGGREQVLLVAVPSSSSLVIHGQEALQRLVLHSERVAAGFDATGAPVSGSAGWASGVPAGAGGGAVGGGESVGG